MGEFNMKKQHFSFQILYITAFSLFFVLLSTLNISAQKPKSLERGVDDKELCSANGRIKDSEYCDYWRIYTNSANSLAARKEARDALIEIVRGQVDEYYKSHKDGRRVKLQWLELLFDILEIGASTTADFINGERAKSIITAALTGFKAGRTAFNKDFKVLQFQTLINKMNADRDRTLGDIYRQSVDGIDAYTWLKAKNDLRNYLFAGTFGNAMDSLVETTGQEASAQNENMNAVKIAIANKTEIPARIQ